MPASAPIRRWFGDWLSNRGGFPLAVVFGATAFQAILLLDPPGWLAQAVFAGTAAGTAICWLRPLSDFGFDRRLRWAGGHRLPA